MNESVTNQTQTREELLMAIVQDFSSKLRNGQQPGIDAYVKQHPDLAEMIRDTLAAVETMIAMDPAEVKPNPDASCVGDELKPHVLGDFRIIREIGRGGMGVVYEAQQLSLRRRVALKVLPFAAMLDERSLQRFKNEVTAAAQLDHPNIVPVYGVGYERGVHHYAMRYVDGVTVVDIIKQLRKLRDNDQAFPDSINFVSSKARHFNPKPNPEEISNAPSSSRSEEPTGKSHVPTDHSGCIGSSQSWKHVRQPSSHFRSIAILGATVARALDSAHSHGIVHRDVKPSNILVDAAGKPWVADFGLAQVESGTAMTMTGDVLGTARYMSPEQLKAERDILDHRTDIYSIGVMLYELLTLEIPFDVQPREKLFQKILLEEPQRPRKVNPRIPNELEAIVLKAIEKNPFHRYQTAEALARDLTRFVENKPVAAKRSSLFKRSNKWISRHSSFVRWSALAGLMLILMLIVATAMIWNEKKQAQASEQQAAQMARESQAVLDFVLDGILGPNNPYYYGQYPKSDEMTVAAALEAAESSIGDRLSDQPVVEAHVRVTIGHIHMMYGRYEVAERHFRRALDLLVDNVGEQDMRRVKAIESLGLCLRYQGKIDEGLDLLAKEQELRVDNGASLISLTTIINLLRLKGQYREAGELGRKVVAYTEKKFGPDDLLTESSMHELAIVLHRQAKYREARDLLEHVLNVRRENLGPREPGTASAMENLGQVIGELGEYDRAESLLRHSIEINKKHIGKDNPMTLVGQRQLVELLCRQGRFIEGKELAQLVLESFCKEVGEQHIETIKAHHTLGEALSGLGDWSDALVHFNLAANNGTDCLGPTHPYTLRALSFKGMVLAVMGDEKAISIRRYLLPHVQAALADAPMTRPMLHTAMAMVWGMTEAAEKNLQDLSVASEIAARLVKEKPDTPQMWTLLGAVCYRRGEFIDAVSSLENAENDPCIKRQFYLAMAHWSADQKSAAREVLRSAVALIDKNQCNHGLALMLRHEAEQLVR